KHRGPGVLADVVGHLEVAERAATLGVRLAFRDAFPVEHRHLLEQIMILKQDRTVGADRQRLVVTGRRGAAVSSGVALGRFASSSFTGLTSLSPRTSRRIPAAPKS